MSNFKSRRAEIVVPVTFIGKCVTKYSPNSTIVNKLKMKILFHKRIVQFNASLLYALSSTFLFAFGVGAQTASRAEITRIQGPNNISLRVNSRPVPANIGSHLGMLPDALTLPGNNRTFAELGFFDAANRALGIRVQTRTRNNITTQYYFPCNLSLGGTAIIEWQNLGRRRGGGRGCDNGFRVDSSGRKITQLTPRFEIGSISKELQELLIGQYRRNRFQLYCSVTGHSGESWIGFSTAGDPCQTPIEECQRSDTDCTVATLDRWLPRESELTSIVACENGQNLSVKGDGATLQDQIEELWQQAKTSGAKFCTLHVLKDDESLALPYSENDRTIVQINNTEPCISYLAFQGTTTIRSARRPEGVRISPGNKYVYCEENLEDPIENFDSSIEPIDLQLFLAKERGFELCDYEQASGGQEGDIRTIQLTDTSGTIEVEYEMYGVPDRLIVTYEGNTILDTGEVSRGKRVSASFSGNSGQVTVEVIGNQENEGTQWNYTLYCPQ